MSTRFGPALWHFTCEHAHRHIGKRGELRPHEHPLMPQLGPVIWFTSDPRPTRDDVGLSSVHIDCDRMAYRYRARVHAPMWWPDVADQVDPAVRADLETYADSGIWWLSAEPVKAVLA